jgi:hypothetical protein
MENPGAWKRIAVALARGSFIMSATIFGILYLVHVGGLWRTGALNTASDLLPDVADLVTYLSLSVGFGVIIALSTLFTQLAFRRPPSKKK